MTESKFSVLNKKFYKILKSIRLNASDKLTVSSLKLYSLNGLTEDKNFLRKYLVFNRENPSGFRARDNHLEESAKNSEGLAKYLQVIGRSVLKFKNWTEIGGKRCAESRTLWRSILLQAKKKPKTLWVKSIENDAPIFSRGYKDDNGTLSVDGREKNTRAVTIKKHEGEFKKNRGSEILATGLAANATEHGRKQKKTGGMGDGVPDDILNSSRRSDNLLSSSRNHIEETALPPPHRCRLSCPLPPSEFVTFADSKDACPSTKLGSPKVSFSYDPFGKSYGGTGDKEVSKTSAEVSTFRIGQLAMAKESHQWKQSSIKHRKIHPDPKKLPVQFAQPEPEPEPQMKALTFLPENLSLNYETVVAPTKIHKDEVLVQVSYSGVCGTDMFITEGKMSCGSGPLILGHEISGKIYAIGSYVNQVKEGDNIVVNPYDACCACRYCSTGNISSCMNEGPQNSIGVSRNGGWAEYVVVKKTQIHKVPEELGLDQAALIHPLSCVICAQHKLEISPGAVVLIQGLGLSGLLWASVLHFRGHRKVVVSDKNQKKRKQFQALNLGYETIDAEEIGKYSVDVAIECTGSPTSIEKCFKTLNPNGQICFFGKPNPTTEIRCTPYDIVSKEIKLVGSNGNAFCFTKAIDLAASMGYRYLDFDKLGVKVFEMKDFKEAFQMKKSGDIIKIMFKLNN